MAKPTHPAFPDDTSTHAYDRHESAGRFVDTPLTLFR